MFALQTFVVFQQPVSVSPTVRREILTYLMLLPFTSKSVPLENLISRVFKLHIFALWLSALLYIHRFALSNQSLKIMKKCGQNLKYLRVILITRVAYIPGLKTQGFPLSGLFVWVNKEGIESRAAVGVTSRLWQCSFRSWLSAWFSGGKMCSGWTQSCRYSATSSYRPAIDLPQTL